MTTPAPNPEAVHLASNARWTEPADPLPVFEKPAWFASAACRGLNPSLFFPEGQGDANPEALATCRGRGVQRACLDYALANNEPGTWGATTQRERARMRGRRRGAA